MNNEAYIALGSNIGDRFESLKDAIASIDLVPRVKVVHVSSIYETDPVGYEDQDQFLNMVIGVKTDLSPFELLSACLEIEKNLGRKRGIRWGPRTIDLDILLYNQENIISEKLTVPHPRMHERAFVIIPLLEIHSGIKLPTMDILLQEVLEEIPDREGVRIWKQINGEDVFALFEN
ncbi:2-amino-4-hydroxy-6-hydroxymethyldihydropteridine diphosphokinase [Bacillus sp. DTU_2020_1000418_1_SI_GHA_SEK_038]|uniref:2-amino-4-hydroxy-6- hydroxymethyldihydropteridine diphosphokinase n=1 Tax=Bacillus sp. DTU_2020_1000418_1_SI_GHA_SEK_038 TaxID=3077585 RepID=UPI0028E7AD53|nr:2-amino-4-hydroxy-6-hydroxymethyldihydropteridine diphosphokinase [Bacillus sp. DTU_2020_1000418_1_SI_GHA_SEK_038]WNS75574.1 2-amino-4-hydroxy-6-hydroxymethyldihydropteridine diphosphokinase [Bacillus sp. DTU_2020_1000418_1_SI_GHA_SEK_038]